MLVQNTRTCGRPLAAGAVSHHRILGGKHQCEPQKTQCTQRTGVTLKREAKLDFEEGEKTNYQACYLGTMSSLEEENV